MRTFGGTVAVLVVLTLAGCSTPSSQNTASSTPTAVPLVTTASPSATPSASPSPTPSPSATAPTKTTAPATAQGDPCTDPNVSFDGLAGIDFDRYARICLGMSFSAASEAMPGPAIEGDGACPWYATVLEISDPGLYVGAMTRPDAPGASIYMFRMTWQGDPGAAAAFDAPATAAGITVGSTSSAISAAYPTSTTVSINDTARGTRTQMIVAGPGGTALVFDVTEGVVTDIYWGKGVSQGAGGELCAL